MSESNGAADETLARITELARAALQAQSSLARQSLDLGRATLAGDVDRTATGRAYVDALTRESVRYWREVGTLGLDYAGELLALGSRAAGRVISESTTAGAASRGVRTSQPGRRSAPPPPEPPPAPVVDRDGARPVIPVLLRAAVGQVAQASVTVVNRHSRQRRVELTASELRDATGTVVALELRVDPDHVTIDAGTEHQVTVEADLDPDLVRPGQRYTGTVEVTGGDEATLGVTVEVAD
ncbi:hypothetical protein ABEG17_10000 [Pedococcus sp. KACC 23699]|uniref:Uncharacterized protein n=1 Tax=Pedococcus sp. KACC 23699 TaxID=3149228 RepID=A0AAU7JNV4_9MICO